MFTTMTRAKEGASIATRRLYPVRVTALCILCEQVRPKKKNYNDIYRFNKSKKEQDIQN